MGLKRRIVSCLVAGVSAALTLALPAQAAAPKVTVAFSSSTFLTNDFAVHGRHLAILGCTTVYEVLADGQTEGLPYPGCSGHVESDGGIAYSRDGAAVATTLTVHYMTPPREVGTSVNVTRAGERVAGADVSATEYATNPDGRARYGTRSADSCVTKALGGDADYTGRLDSALPAVAAGPEGSWYVADRDGNTIYRLNRAGKLSVLAVLPPVNGRVSSELAASQNWPSCVVGAKVAFEAAPSELEVAANGIVYVAGRPSLRSGATADHSNIYAINPTTKRVTTLAQHYPGRVDLAVGTRGRLFVARPDANRIMVIRHGRSAIHLKLPRVQAIESDSRGQLYAVRSAGTASPTENPTVVRIS
jgi:hypothetical protein